MFEFYIMKEVKDLCNKIMECMNELGISEFVLYSSDYPADKDEELVEDLDTAISIGWYVHMNDSYDGFSRESTCVRKIRIKDDNVVFDLEIYYEDDNGNEEIKGTYENQTIDDITSHGQEDVIIDALNSIIDNGLNDDYIVKLNRE